MDIRSWPWKKKSSEKTASTTDATASLPDNDSKKGDQGKTKIVQIPAETYAHLTEMEAQGKVLNEKLSTAQSEITTKDNLVKQHARVAEEAIAGWEKAEAEASELKTQLESVTLLKLTAEDRASHLDEALKECMKDIQNVKEESHDTLLAKTKQWEVMKSELEARIDDFEQELLRNNAENSTLSRSLQDRSSMLVRISDEKAEAEAEIEVLKSTVQSCEKDINSLKYEVHIVTKELEIRNEEKNMSMRLAETANKQHLEDAKKISKLEAECQRLRGLVKKKLPGPAALAQMKLEVESLGREYGEPRLRRSPAKSPSSYLAPSSPTFSLEDLHQCQKENEFLTARLLATEEETKMLKEVLSKRNNELQATRTICAKTSSKLRSIESQVSVMNHKDPMKSNVEFSLEGFLSRYLSNPSLTSMSEDGIDEEGSCSESCSTAIVSETLQLKENKIEKNNKADKSKHAELMDDFLEMEKLACLSTESNGNISDDAVQMGGDKEKQNVGNTITDRNMVLLSKLKSRITSLFEAGSLETHVDKLLEDIRQIVQDIYNELPQRPSKLTDGQDHSGNGTSKQEHSPIVHGEAADKLCNNKHVINEELKNAISQIHDIVVPLCKEAVEIQGRPAEDHILREKVTEFSASINKVQCDEINLDNFIFALSHVLSETRDVRFNMLTDNGKEGEANSNDCIDKLTLLEKRIAQHEPAKPKLSGESGVPSPSSSDPANSQTFYLEDYEQMKLEKDHMETELARSTETSERAKLQLAEMEQQLAQLKSQLAACQKSNSLADTQLKCMAESYKSLESRTQELETEINLLRSKAEALDSELQEERCSHQDVLAKYKDLQEQYERDTRCPMCSVHAEADADKAKQDREIAAATGRLAECQEMILLLGRQLKAMQPPIESSSSADKLQMNDYLSQGEPSPSSCTLQSALNTVQPDQASTDNDDASSVILRTGEDDSTLDDYNSHLSTSNLDSLPPRPDGMSSKRQKNRSRSASSSSSLSGVLNEKQSRGFSRLFSRGKSDH